MNTVLLYRIIAISIILIGAVTYIIITQRKYRRLLKEEMEKIRMREMERHNRDLRRREAVEVHPISYGEPGILFIEKEAKIEPLKHMKRHSIR